MKTLIEIHETSLGRFYATKTTTHLFFYRQTLYLGCDNWQYHYKYFDSKDELVKSLNEAEEYVVRTETFKIK